MARAAVMTELPLPSSVGRGDRRLPATGSSEDRPAGGFLREKAPVGRSGSREACPPSCAAPACARAWLCCWERTVFATRWRARWSGRACRCRDRPGTAPSRHLEHSHLRQSGRRPAPASGEALACGRPPMSDLARHVEDYLRLRRALGFKLQEGKARFCLRLVAYIESSGSATLTVELAVAWARLPKGVQPITWAHRLFRGSRFCHLPQDDRPKTEVPPPDVLATSARRPTLYLWSDTDIRRLLEAARRIQPPLRAATHEAIFGLLAVAGLRVGEAIGLQRDDADLGEGLLTIREAKFGRSRLVPLHPSATEALPVLCGLP